MGTWYSTAHYTAFGALERRFQRSQQKGIAQPDALQRPAHHPRFQRLNVGGYVRQLGHSLLPQPPQARLKMPPLAAIESQKAGRFQRVVHYRGIPVVR